MMKKNLAEQLRVTYHVLIHRLCYTVLLNDGLVQMYMGGFFFFGGISEKYLSALMIYFGDTGAFIKLLYNRNEDLRKWQVF